MITGAHSIIYSDNAEADRAFFREVLKFNHVDVGDGWLIFKLPPAELAVHPGGTAEHELYLMCEDIQVFLDEMKKHKVTCEPVQDQGYGLVTSITLPGGSRLGVYEARHERP